MNSNIKIKIGIIIAVVLVCLYGVIGIPKSKDELLANWKKNVHLGLDLSGGTQLVMQVQLQDAFKADADKIEIDVKGVPGDKSGNFRSIVSNQFTAWVPTALSSTDYKLTMKPSE